jgi:hypothetical protein
MGVYRDGKPLFYIFRNCEPVYSTLSEMIFDQNNPEDVLKVDADENGTGGDDSYDMVRYGLMSRPRPVILQKPKPAPNSVIRHIQRKEQERWARSEYV